MDGLPSAADVLVRAVAFASHALVFGLVPVFVLVLRPALRNDRIGEEARARVARRAEGVVLAALVAAVAATAGALLLQAAEAADLLGTALGARSFEVVARTPFGFWHLARVPLCGALAALLAGRVRAWSLGRGPARWWVLWGLLGATLLLSLSLSGHAAASERGLLAVPNDVIHLAAASTWLAGVVALTFLLPAAGAGLEVVAPATDRFARVALPAMAVVAATGAGNAVLHLDSPADLVATGYGRALGLKLCAFACILGLGARNHFVLRARLVAGLREGRPVAEQALLRRAVALEVVLAALVLGATAVLVNLPPPR